MARYGHLGYLGAAAFVVVGLFAASPAGAQSGDFSLGGAGPAEEGWTLGLGVGAAPDYEGSEDYEAVPIPKVRWDRGDGVYADLTGLTFTANVLANRDFEFGPVVQVRGERDDVDNDAVDRLDDVDTAVEVGAFLKFLFGDWSIGGRAQVDVADAHDGWLAELRGGYDGSIGSSWSYTAGAYTTYASDDYMEAYFGIDAANSAASGLSTFDADAGLKDVGVDFSMTYLDWRPWAVTGIVAYKRLLDDAEDSPVTDDVGSENQVFIGLLGSYRF